MYSIRLPDSRTCRLTAAVRAAAFGFSQASSTGDARGGPGAQDQVGAPGEVQGVQAQAIRAFLLTLRRGQNLDTVSSGELGEAGRIGRDGLGQSQLAGRLARSRDELVESAW